MASGIFIPMMVVGGSLGRYVGWIVAQIVPQLTIDSSIYAVVGSAALMAGMILVNFIFVAYIALQGRCVWLFRLWLSLWNWQKEPSTCCQSYLRLKIKQYIALTILIFWSLWSESGLAIISMRVFMSI